MTRVVLYDQGCIYIDGYKNIVSFDEGVIVLACHKKELIISGKGLYIESFNKIEMTIKGCIYEVKWGNT